MLAMYELARLACSPFITTVAAVTGIKPRGTRHVAHTSLMGVARVVLVVLALILATSRSEHARVVESLQTTSGGQQPNAPSRARYCRSACHGGGRRKAIAATTRMNDNTPL
jgi:hypothetical protein